MESKTELLERGRANISAFCKLNSLVLPDVHVTPSHKWPYDVCAYYRPTYIEICPARCAAVGVAGPAWSYPGYVVDRTPYGVLAHELGHHADVVRSTKKDKYYGDYSIGLRKLTKEEKLTNYCPNDAEWFAEIFRLFVTNPDLLRLLRPLTYAQLHRDFKPGETRPWYDIMKDAPERTFAAAEKKIAKAPGALCA